MAASSRVDRGLIFRRDESVLVSNTIDQEITSAIKSASFHSKATAHIWIINPKMNSKGGSTAIMHQNATAQTAMWYCDIIITAARMLDKAVVDVHANESWDRLKIQGVPHIRYIGIGAEGLRNMRGEFEAEN